MTGLEALKMCFGHADLFDRLAQDLAAYESQVRVQMEARASALTIVGPPKIERAHPQNAGQSDDGLRAVRAFLSYRSAGYEPLLMRSGFGQLPARGMAALAVRHGKRRARESKRQRPVNDAIRFLSGRVRQQRAILQRARVLIAAWKETSIISEIFDKAGLTEFEFIGLLKSVVEGREANCGRIAEIAATVAPSLSPTRGPKVSAASAAHEFLLRSGVQFVKQRRPYSRQNRADDYVDALTEATRREFGLPDFDSRPARRRLRRRKSRTQ